MPWEFVLLTKGFFSFRKMYGLSFVLDIALAIGANWAAFQAQAQQEPEFAVEGYITAVQSPTRFEVYGIQVESSPNTNWRITGKDAAMSYGQPLRSLAHVGVYVRVAGPTNRHTHIVAAEEISLRDDWDRKLSGIGVIDKVFVGGPQPAFRADGYRIQITSATEVVFSGGLTTLNELAPNTWLNFEGKLDKSGVLMATKIDFLPNKATHFKAINGIEIKNITVSSAPDATPGASSSEGSENEQPGDNATKEADAKPANQNVAPAKQEKKHYSAISSTHLNEVDNKALQARIQRIGMAVVPAYQKALSTDNPSKIQFLFAAVDNRKYRSEICSADGLIALPQTVVERLKTDDQLAAVLADGIAYNIQRQAARVVSVNRMFLAAGIAGDIAGAFVPGVGIAELAVGAGTKHKFNVEIDEERGRIALALMDDAGYDLRQAPEAWRLLAPKHLPAKLNELKYPNHSGYQLSVLNLQYRKAAPDDAASTANISTHDTESSVTQ